MNHVRYSLKHYLSHVHTATAVTSLRHGVCHVLNPVEAGTNKLKCQKNITHWVHT